MFYRQCDLLSRDGTVYSCWLPANCATRGNRIRIIPYDHTQWTVMTVYPMALPVEDLERLGEEHRYHKLIVED